MNARRVLLGLWPVLLALTSGANAHGATLFVYNAVSGDASLVTQPGTPRVQVKTLPALSLGRWNVRIGVIDGQLLTLDTEGKRIHTIPLDRLRDARPALHSTPLHAGLVPYRAVIRGDRVFVDYFAANRIEVYRWRAEGLSYLGEHVLPDPRPLGLSELLVRGHQLLVAASGIHCLARVCPRETHADPHVLGFALDRDPLGELRTDLRPANGNAAGLYMHPGSEATFVLNAGDYRGGYSSIQRVYADNLGPEVRLARSAGAARAFPLDARTCLILQFSGEHAFVFDTQDERVVSIVRFDGKQFVAVKELSERFKSDLQDLLPDPAAKDRFFIVDSKREQLLHVAWKPPASLELLGSTSLRTAAFRSSPSWALWL
ncbi:MAG TPA: hypothetical protein VJV78_11690 [Polyangiales bacterium]|nr:hypothetical protein [Polyangiales bacterium]